MACCAIGMVNRNLRGLARVFPTGKKMHKEPNLIRGAAGKVNNALSVKGAESGGHYRWRKLYNLTPPIRTRQAREINFDHPELRA